MYLRETSFKEDDEFYPTHLKFLYVRINLMCFHRWFFFVWECERRKNIKSEKESWIFYFKESCFPDFAFFTTYIVWKSNGVKDGLNFCPWNVFFVRLEKYYCLIVDSDEVEFCFLFGFAVCYPNLAALQSLSTFGMDWIKSLSCWQSTEFLFYFNLSKYRVSIKSWESFPVLIFENQFW